jgi:exonuclease SbcD
MRIVHTSDWHAGRIWKNVDRHDELEAVLDHLASFVEREHVDLVLVTGDLFDNGAPSARAERTVFRFFKRVGQAGAQSVVIAGNHDSGARLEAWGELASLVGVHVVGQPKPPDRGGVIEIHTRSGETATVAALPFAAQRTLVSALELAGDDTLAMQRYADKLGRIVQLLCARFRQDTVNLLLAHTHLDGALFTGSERRVHLGDEWAASAQAFPANAHYVALGHIHRPQDILGPSPIAYAGSPMQLDFGEAGEVKSFVVVDAAPGRPATIRREPYQGAKPLREERGTLAELEARAEELREAGWLKVVLKLDEPDPEVARKVRRFLENAVVIEVDAPEGEAVASSRRTLADASPVDVYRDFYAQRHGGQPSDELLERFRLLMEEASR